MAKEKLSPEIPIASLKIELHMSNPPDPIGFHVIVEGKTIAILLPDVVEQELFRFNRMKEIYRLRKKS